MTYSVLRKRQKGKGEANSKAKNEKADKKEKENAKGTHRSPYLHIIIEESSTSAGME